jgi:hypothetical protein
VKTSEGYWEPICDLVKRLRCWSRLAACDGAADWITDWANMLIIPVAGYLEPSEGPVPIRFVRWVEISTRQLEKQIGQPAHLVDIGEAILSGLRDIPIVWELRDATWSHQNTVGGQRWELREETVQVVHLPNPFFEKRR